MRNRRGGRICAASGLFGVRQHRMPLAAVIFLALLCTHLIAAVTGVAMPFGLKRLGSDPAQSVCIFATTITNCVGFLATLWLAHLLIFRLA